MGYKYTAEDKDEMAEAVLALLRFIHARQIGNPEIPRLPKRRDRLSKYCPPEIRYDYKKESA